MGSIGVACRSFLSWRRGRATDSADNSPACANWRSWPWNIAPWQLTRQNYQAAFRVLKLIRSDDVSTD